MSYLGTQPNDVKKNTGLYTPSEILQLEKDGHWGGSLELIETQNATGVSVVDFTDLKNYDTHYVSYTGLETASNSQYTQMRFSNDGGTTFESGASAYTRAVQYGGTNGAFGERRSVGITSIGLLSFSNANTPMNGYAYLSNLQNSSKYSFVTQHSSIGTLYFYWGAYSYPTAETINAIRILNNGSINFTAGTVSLFGLKDI